ncbi:MAG TPA: hypothetical protein VHL98_10900 [Microvirga sp.]|jgi:hypothetical protein|nr:hypothetical protein [Microvirga sp.]
MADHDRLTYHVVQAYQRTEEGWIADEPWSGQTAGVVQARAAVLATMRTYVIAFSRTGDTQLGEFEEPTVLAEYGTPPPENDEFATW